MFVPVGLMSVPDTSGMALCIAGWNWWSHSVVVLPEVDLSEATLQTNSAWGDQWINAEDVNGLAIEG